MYCPFCHHEHSRVTDSRMIDAGAAIRRRRECTECGGRFTTVEKAVLTVVKRNGVSEPFDRDKLIVGHVSALALSLIHISEPTRRHHVSRMPSSA